MHTELTHLRTVTNVQFNLIDAEPRPVQYSRGSVKYQPQMVGFSIEGPNRQVSAVTIRGMKYKMDGTLSKNPSTERVMSFDEQPEFITRLVAEALMRMDDTK